jgi:hypothetical protein
MRMRSIGGLILTMTVVAGCVRGAPGSPVPSLMTSPSPTASLGVSLAPSEVPSATADVGATPAPVATPRLGVSQRDGRLVRVGDVEVSFIDVRSIQLEGFPHPRGFPNEVWWNLIGDRTLVLTEAGTRSLAIPAGEGRFATPGLGIWLGDIHSGEVVRIHKGAGALDVDRTGELILAWTGDDNGIDLRVIDIKGNEISSIRTVVPHAAFLMDGHVAVVDGDRIGVWEPRTSSIGWVSLPDGFRNPVVTAVGTNIVVNCEECQKPEDPGNSVLIDPRTGTELGGRWTGEAYQAAANPDGTHFVVAVENDGRPRGDLELHEGATGAVVASYRGATETVVDQVVWLTDNVIVVMRAPLGAAVDAVPELHEVDDFDAEPTRTDLFVDEQTLRRHRDGLLVRNGDGDVMLMRLVESR